MTTTIDNGQKVFMLTGDMNRTVFCNLDGIPAAAQTFDSLTAIYYFWNWKQKKCGKVFLNDMFKAHGNKFRIK